MATENSQSIGFLDILTDDQQKRRNYLRRVYGQISRSETTRRTFGFRKEEWKYIDGTRDLSTLELDYDAIVIGGSLENPLRESESPWMRSVFSFILRVVDREIPLLGICGGLQFTARALGVNVVHNKSGREFGPTTIELTEAGTKDPLFDGVSSPAMVFSSHAYSVEDIPPTWKILAQSASCEAQAVAIGSRIRLLQFHPEMSPGRLKRIALERKSNLVEEGVVSECGFDQLCASIDAADTVGPDILHNFKSNLTRIS